MKHILFGSLGTFLLQSTLIILYILNIDEISLIAAGLLSIVILSLASYLFNKIKEKHSL